MGRILGRVLRRSHPIIVILVLLVALAAGCAEGIERSESPSRSSTGTPAATSERVPGTTTPPTPGPLAPSEGFDVTTVTLSDGDATIALDVFVADTPALRARGLSQRQRLPDDAGMVFLFEQPRPVRFWMRDTLIPLSIAYVGADGVVDETLDMDPCTSTPCQRYPSSQPVRFALEVNQGWFARHGVTAGWTLEMSASAPRTTES